MKQSSHAAVVGPTGKLLTIDDLPPSDTRRWVIRRKAEVVLAVRAGLISIEEVCHRYHLTRDEFQSWERLLHKYGFLGLRITQLQNYRMPAVRNNVVSLASWRSPHR